MMNQYRYVNPFDKLRPGDPATLVQPFEEMPSHSKVVLQIRESHWTQAQSGNADDQERGLRRACRKAGHTVVAVETVIESGWNFNLVSLRELAREHKAVILAETIDRIARPRAYHSVNNPSAVLTKGDLRMVRAMLDGVPVFTLENPHASPGQNRSCQTKRGMRYKSYGGAPLLRHKPGFRAKRKAKCLRLVLKLARHGYGSVRIQRRILRKLGVRVSRPTLNRWIVRA